MIKRCLILLLTVLCLGASNVSARVCFLPDSDDCGQGEITNMTVTCESQGGYDTEDKCSNGKKTSQICYPNNDCYYRKCQYDSKANCEKHVNINRYKCLSETVDDTTCYYAVAKSCSEIDSEYKSSYNPETEAVDDTIIDANGNKCYKTHKKRCWEINTRYQVACSSLGGQDTGRTGSDGTCFLCYTCADKEYIEIVAKDSHCWKCDKCPIGPTFKCEVRKDLATSEYKIVSSIGSRFDPNPQICLKKNCADKFLKTEKSCASKNLAFIPSKPAVRASDGVCGTCTLKTCKQQDLVAKADCDTQTNTFTENKSVTASDAPCGTCTKIETGCKGTEVMVGDKCVQLADNYTSKDFITENLLPYFTIEDTVCPGAGYIACPNSLSLCANEQRNYNTRMFKRLQSLRNNVVISSLRMSSLLTNGRINQIARAKEFVDGTLCMDDDCSTTASYEDLYKGTKKWAKGMKYHRNHYTTCKKAIPLVENLKDKQYCSTSLANWAIDYVNAVNGCLIEITGEENYVERTHRLSFEEVADLYKKNVWKFDRSKYVFTFAIPDLDNNLEKYTLGNASGDEFAIVGNDGNQYVYFSSDMNNTETIDVVDKNNTGEKSELNIKNFDAKVKSYIYGVDFNKGYPADFVYRTKDVEGQGTVDDSVYRAKTYYKDARFTFAGGVLRNTIIRTGTMTIKGDTTLNNVTIIADNIVFNNDASLYVLGENNQIRGDRYYNGGRYSMHEATFSGSAGALYVDRGNITIYGKSSGPVFSEIAVFGGKVQMFGYSTLSKKYSVKSSGQISLQDNDAYQYALQNFYYTDGKSAPQSGVDVTHYVVNDIIVGGNEEICSVLTCKDFGAYSKGKGWTNEYADEKRIQTVCDGFKDSAENSFECVKGSIPLYCADSDNACRTEIWDTYFPDWEKDAFCAEISSEQDAQSKCEEIRDGYTILGVRVVGYGDKKGSKKCAICLYDSEESQ